jgi:hypothetical protein
VSRFPIDALKYGLIGLGFLLALLSFLLLQNEQRRNPPRKVIFRQIYSFMAFSLCLMGFGLFGQSYSALSSSSGADSSLDAAYEGDWNFELRILIMPLLASKLFIHIAVN